MIKLVFMREKILVVSTVAPHRIGGIQNLYTLLSALKPDRYCVLTTHRSIRGQLTNQPLRGECFYCDPQEPLNPVDVRDEASPSVKSRSQSQFRTWARQTVLGKYYRHVYSFLVFRYRAARSAIRFLVSTVRMIWLGYLIVQRRNIRGLVGISDTGPALISTYMLSRLCRLPYVIYLFDIYLGNNLGTLENHLAKFFEPLLIKRAVFVLLTNEGTETYYRDRYGDTFRPAILHNSISPAQYERVRTQYSPSPPYRIVFTGNVYWAQERSVVNLIRTMDELRDSQVLLDLYIPNPPQSVIDQIRERKNIRLTSAPATAMPRIQCSASILFLPLSWDTPAPDIIATATPGKLTDYLASGRPILIHAPSCAWINQYARQEGFGLVIDEESIAKLKDGVLKLIKDKRFARRLVRNAKKTFYKNHMARSAISKFISILESAFDIDLHN